MERLRRYREDRRGGRLLPLSAAALAAAVAIVVAAVQGRPLPLDVAGVFLLIGVAAVVVARSRPWRGALFVAALAAVVIAVLYAG